LKIREANLKRSKGMMELEETKVSLAVSETLGQIAQRLFTQAGEWLGEVGNQKALRHGAKVAKLAVAVEKASVAAKELDV
jgi:hypothetical protein